MARKRRTIAKPASSLVSESDAEENAETMLYDEVEQFSEMKNKIPLQAGRDGIDSESEEEVLDVRSTDEEEDEEDIDGQDMGETACTSSDSAEEEDENEVEEDWGKKKSDFYNTDFQSDEHAGFNESDEEAAQLEEAEAMSLQKRLLNMTTDQDYGLGETFGSQIPVTEASALLKQVIPDAEAVKTDVSHFSEDKKLELLERKSPELVPLINDFKRERDFLCRVLLPLMRETKLDEGHDYTCSVNFDTARFSFEVHLNFLINVAYYLTLKAHHVDCTNHPVLDRILQWRKLLNKVQSSYADISAYLESTDQNRSSPSKKQRKLKSKLKKPTFSESSKQSERKGASATLLLAENKGETEDGPEDKRGITFEMAKNRGMLPKRKKEVRNPRVKYRNRYHKAVVKRRSQIPDVKFETDRYSGEARGINPNLVKSVKLS